MNGQRLRGIRKAKGLTVKNVADKIGVTRVSVSRWESGVHDPDDDTKRKLANFFDVPIGYLMGADDPVHDTKDQSGGGVIAMSEKNETSSVDSEVIVSTSGNIVIERERNNDRDKTRIILPPTPRMIPASRRPSAGYEMRTASSRTPLPITAAKELLSGSARSI